MPATPFTNPHLTDQLYSDAPRLAQRTSALHAAKIDGADATATIIELARKYAPRHSVVCDIGCGRGTSTLALASTLRPARLIALDRSQALLDVTAARLRKAGHRVELLQADFHHVPIPTNSVDLAIAAFCLYHSANPQVVIGGIARILRPGGHAVFVTKSADSYHALDQLLTETGLDPHATTRPSLYQSFHSSNAATLVAQSLSVENIVEQQHVFRFDTLNNLASYLATSPKYILPEKIGHNPEQLADALRNRGVETPITTSSTITYVVSAKK